MQATPLIEPSASPAVAPAAALETCCACGRTIGRLEQPFIWGQDVVCFGCHRDLEHAPAADDTDAATAVADYRFFNDETVRVTRKRVVINRAVYRVSQIRFARLQRTVPRRVYAVATALAGLAFVVVGLNRHLDRVDLSLLLTGSAIFIAGLIIVIARRPRYSILIAVDDSESVALSTQNFKYASRVLNAIGEAVIERGQMPISQPASRHARVSVPARAQR